jgi:hypothetical protein
MKYANMEEAAGQYLAGVLFNSNISVLEDDNGQKILVEPEFSNYKANCLLGKFQSMLVLIRLIKNSRKDDIVKDAAVYVGKMAEEEFDEFILAEILIHAVKAKYIGKATATDIFAEIGKPKITVFFLNETKDIDGEESLEL